MQPSRFLGLALLVVCAFVAACGGGSSTPRTLTAAVQDLDVDPDGLTTVLTFDGAAPALPLAAITASGGQGAIARQVVGSTLVVTWEERVTPSHTVRVSQGDPVGVTTTDGAAPTYAIVAAAQNPGLGADTITIEFSGPRVVPTAVTSPETWTLVVGGVQVPLVGGDFDFDAATQVLTITTGEEANLHASFALRASGLTSVADTPVGSGPVAGVATGDTTAPQLVQAVQRLGEDAFGRVVDFEFDEAMSPLFSTQITNWSNGLFSFAQTVEQVAPETLRVRFAQPVVPGLDSVSLIAVLDAHGNAYAGGATGIVAGSALANAYSTDPVVETVSGASNDRLVIVTDQALAPATATSAAAWELSIGGTPVDLAAATFQYQLTQRRLTVTLPVDQPNGTAFELTPVAVLDVDGDAFAQAFQGTLAGDSVAPTVTLAIQNRNVDPDGRTVDVWFSEALAPAFSADPANFTVSGGQSISAATLIGSGQIVRVELSAVAVPGIHTFAVAGVRDLAGNTMVPLGTAALVSTDFVPPSAVHASAAGILGADNDTVTVTFDDLLVDSDVTNPANWSVESPLGNPLDTASASVSYDPTTHVAVLTFDAGNGVAFEFGDDFAVSFSGVRDVAGNTITSAVLGGTAVVEGGAPGIEAVFVRSAPHDNQVWVRFDEPVKNHADQLAVWRLRDGNGLVVSTPSLAPTLSADGRGVLLVFGVLVVPGTHTLDVLGVTDLAANPLLPALSHPIAAEDPHTLGFDAGSSAATAVAGEENDVLSFVFDRAPTRAGLLDPSNYGLSIGGQPVSLAGALVAFDGDRTVTLTLRGGLDLPAGQLVELSFSGLVTAQGLGGGTVAEMVVVDGDVAAPALAAGSVRIDALDPAHSTLVDFSEAVTADTAGDPASYTLEGVPAFFAERVGPRTARVTFAIAPQVGDELEAQVADLAGNLGIVTRLVTAADVAGPLVTSVSGLSRPGYGGDEVRIRFHKPIVPSVALSTASYAVSSGGVGLDLSAAQISYESVHDEVVIRLAPGQELAGGQTVTVTLSGVVDHAGFPMVPAVVHGAVTGDDDEPVVEGAFVDHRRDAGGLVVEVRFAEDVQPQIAADPASWAVSGGQSVVTAQALMGTRIRLTLDAPLAPGDSLTAVGIADAAGNVAAPLVVVPVH